MGLFKGLFLFGVGLYSGVYVCQNYDIPKMDDPEKLLKKAKDYLAQFEKPPEKPK